MKDKFWIYMSCLIFCCAIAYRVWQFENEAVKRARVENVKSNILEDLKENYPILKGKLIRLEKERKIHDTYNEMLFVTRYLFDRKEILQLRDLYIKMVNSSAITGRFERFSLGGRLYTETEIVSFLGEEIELYYYTNIILTHIFNNCRDNDSPDLLIDVDVVDLKNMENNIFGIEFNISSELEKGFDVEYQSEGKLLPQLNGGAATKEKPKDIRVSFLCPVTGERRTFDISKIKV